MKQLCEAATAQQHEAKKPVVSSYKKTVKPRIKEFEHFQQQKGDLLHLCLEIQNIKGKLENVSRVVYYKLEEYYSSSLGM